MKQENKSPKVTKPINDYLRIMTASPDVKVADVMSNLTEIMKYYDNAKEQQVELLVLPELCLTGYSAADLFLNDRLLEQSVYGLETLARHTADGPAIVVGVPLVHNNLLYNCGVVLAEGKMAGAVPKSYLPNYNEFYEKRWFSSGKQINRSSIVIAGETVPFGVDLLFVVNGTSIGVEICEDAWSPVTPSASTALAGAEIIVNLSASNEIIGKTEYRQQMISGLSSKLLCAYIYCSSGTGESDADVVYGGHQMIYELGHLVSERLPHSTTNDATVADVDRTYINHERLVNKTFAEQAQDTVNLKTYQRIEIKLSQPNDNKLLRTVDYRPFVPSNPQTLNKRCQEIIRQMSEALASRITGVSSKALVLGLSGGLDSTLALIVAAETTKILNLKHNFIHTVTMPGPASSDRTQDNATMLAKALKTTHRIMPIDKLTSATLLNIGHNSKQEDTTYENTQARMRTLLLMNYANMVGGIVQGTGDMSENAQGWCTYNGDQMSMYNPNTSVPKTLVRHLVGWYADNKSSKDICDTLHDILATPVSPELTGNGDLSQTTEQIIGPYELHDFFLYNLLRRGSRPSKIHYLASCAFSGEYDDATISKWLESFMSRFTASQWKREAMPGGPKIGTVSLSPRGDLRMAPNTSQDWYK